ncbi:hypothetical protein C9426_24655 [Serratia sp. S1B]|nr:hypothetical protein C9426_24655 [Serratia sp. S1B]
MPFWRDKAIMIFLIKIIASLLCSAILIFAHDLGHHLYTSHFTTRSRGVGLGFVAFYIKFFIIPSLFIISFVSFRIGIILCIVVLAYLFFQWFPSNPLRVTLIALSAILSYLVIFMMKKRIDRYANG